MLQLSASLINQRVLSLRTGGPIATTTSVIINPNNLKIEGFYCQDMVERGRPVLIGPDIREIIPQGFIVNDYDVLTDPEELVRLKEIFALDFQLLGKPVITVSKQRLGKVNDYAADNQSLFIQKIYVTPTMLRSLTGNQLSIDRSQIVEITSRQIVVQDLLQTAKASSAVGAPA